MAERRIPAAPAGDVARTPDRGLYRSHRRRHRIGRDVAWQTASYAYRRDRPRPNHGRGRLDGRGGWFHYARYAGMVGVVLGIHATEHPSDRFEGRTSHPVRRRSGREENRAEWAHRLRRLRAPAWFSSG